MKKKQLNLPRAEKKSHLLGSQQANSKKYGKKLNRLLANLHFNDGKQTVHIDHFNVVVLYQENFVEQLNAILEKDNNVTYTKTKNHVGGRKK